MNEPPVKRHRGPGSSNSNASASHSSSSSSSNNNNTESNSVAFPARSVRVSDFAASRLEELRSFARDARERRILKHRAHRPESGSGGTRETRTSSKRGANNKKPAGDGFGKRAFQLLPPHLRRRSMSHKAWRVPLFGGLRRIAQHEAKRTDLAVKSSKKAQKLPSKYAPVILYTSTGKRKVRRKHGVRPAYLRLMYRFRQHNGLWTETHIWHAKRCHMQALFGMKLPWTPTDKTRGGLRSVHKSLRKHCLVEDVSYEYMALELTSHRVDLIAKLCAMHCHVANTTSHPGIKALQRGNRMGDMLWYVDGRSPNQVVGPVRFLWVSATDTNQQRGVDMRLSQSGGLGPPGARLWLFCHVALFEQVQLCIRISLAQFAEGTIDVEPLPHALSSFRLRGVRSAEVVWRALRASLRGGCARRDCHCLEQEEKLKLAENRLNKFDVLSSLPANCVLALHAHDPRQFFPPSRCRRKPSKDTTGYAYAPPLGNATTSSARDTGGLTSMDAFWPASLAKFENESSLWDRQTRRALLAARFNESKPRESAPMKERLPQGPAVNEASFIHSQKARRFDGHIPILVLVNSQPQQSAKNRNQATSSIDVVVPSGWAMPFWMQLVYAGATRVMGQRQKRYIETIEGRKSGPALNGCFPYDWIDTEASTAWTDGVSARLEVKWHSTPPAKRCNFEAKTLPRGFKNPQLWPKEDVMSGPTLTGMDPFRSNWSGLFPNADLTVSILRGPSSHIEASLRSGTLPTWAASSTNYLVQISVSMESRGLPEDGCLLCLPRPEDLAKKKSPDPIASGDRRQLVGYLSAAGLSYSEGKGVGIGCITFDAAAKVFRDRLDGVSIMARLPRHSGYRLVSVSLRAPTLY